MKTKVLKSVLPIAAIVFAIGLAFATEAENVITTGYYLHPTFGVQQVPGGVNCPTEGDEYCIYDDQYEVFADEDLEIRLYKEENNQ